MIPLHLGVGYAIKINPHFLPHILPHFCYTFITLLLKLHVFKYFSENLLYVLTKFFIPIVYIKTGDSFHFWDDKILILAVQVTGPTNMQTYAN